MRVVLYDAQTIHKHEILSVCGSACASAPARLRMRPPLPTACRPKGQQSAHHDG